jgi:predicted RNase H-like HicB family nuclease
MKTEDRYLKFVRWSDEDQFYVGYCPDLFPWGGVCHGVSEEETFSQLCALVREEIADLKNDGKEIPVPATRAMRDAVMA